MIKRPDNHIKETKSLAYVQTVWADWAVNKLDEDYGVDLDIVIFENNEITDINFPAQLKSTDKLNIKDGLISFSIDTEHLIYFFNHVRPFLFIVYDNQNEIAYWLIIQDYIWDNLNIRKPNWRNQKYNTLYFPVENTIEDKNHLKEAIMNTGKRVIQENSLKLRFGEGLGLNGTLEDIEKLEELEEKTELKVKETKLMLFNKFVYQGNIEEANKKIMDIYNQNKRDVMHLKSIIALTSILKVSDIIENKKRVDLCFEGIDIAKELENTTVESLLTILKNKAIHFVIIDNISNLLYSKKVYSQSELGQANLIFVDKELEELIKISIALNEEINLALNNLIKNEEYYLLVYCLTELLDMSTAAIVRFKIFDRESEFIKDEIKDKNVLANYLLQGIDVFKDKELELYIKSSVAGFYYHCSENPEAINLMEEALDIAITLDNKPEIERINIFLNRIKENPNPYLIKDENWQLKLTTKEYQELLRDSLKYLGINFDSEDHITKAIVLGLKDADPEKYFKFCKNIYMVYLGSNLGKTIVLPSLGYKLIYCSQEDIYVEGTSLEFIFNFLKKKHCEKCKKRSPREPNWKCKVDWFEKMRQSDMIQEVLKKKYEAEKNMNSESM